MILAVLSNQKSGWRWRMNFARNQCCRILPSLSPCRNSKAPEPFGIASITCLKFAASCSVRFFHAGSWERVQSEGGAA